MIGTKSADKIEYIYSKDPAVDREHPDYSVEEYWRTWDRKHMPMREGCEPTLFELRKLTRRQFLRVLSLEPHEQASEAIAYSLRALKNFYSDGKPLELKTQRSDLGDRLSNETLEKLFAADLFGELGLRVISFSTLDPTLGQG